MIIKQSVMSRILYRFKFFSRFLKCFIFCCLTHFPWSWEAEVVHIILRKDQIPFWLASRICIQQALRFDLWIVGNSKSFKYQNLIEKIWILFWNYHVSLFWNYSNLIFYSVVLLWIVCPYKNHILSQSSWSPVLVLYMKGQYDPSDFCLRSKNLIWMRIAEPVFNEITDINNIALYVWTKNCDLVKYLFSTIYLISEC